MENEKVIEEQGLSISDLFFLVKRNIVLIIIITGLLTVVGAVYGLKIKKPTYSATATAVVMIETSGNQGSPTTSDYVYASYYTSTFTTFIQTNPVLNLASEKLSKKGHTVSREQLDNCITVSSYSDSLIITVQARVAEDDRNKGVEKSMDIANTVLEAAIEIGNQKIKDADGKEVYKYKVFANNLVVMENVEEEDVTASRGAFTITVICMLLGLVLSFGIILIKYLVDDTFTSKELFEKTHNINVLSVIAEVIEYGDGGKK